MISIMEHLTLKQQFRLIEIAHETSNYEIKEAALQLLRNINFRPVFIPSQHPPNPSYPS